MARALALILVALIPAPVAAAAEVCLAVPTLDDRCEAWVDVLDSPGGARWGEESASDVVAAGGRVFTVGGTYPEAVDWTRHDALVVAHDAVTGVRLWTDRFDGTSRATDYARAAAASPDGSTVYVAGFTDLRIDNSVDPSCGAISDCEVSDFLVIAYQAASGQRRWVARYDGSDLDDHGRNEASAVTVSPDGATVYVTGSGCPTPGVLFVGTGPMSCDYATVAYDAASGAELWSTRNTPDRVDERPSDIVAAGDAVVVTGWRRQGAGTGVTDVLTVAYETEGERAGEQRWSRTFDGGVGGTDQAEGLAVAGTRVVVAGSVQASTGNLCAALAYELTDGSRSWTMGLKGGPSHDACVAAGVAAGSAGVFLAGTASVIDSSLPPDGDHLLVSLNPADGAVRWTEISGFPGANVESLSAVALSGSVVAVAGSSSELYNAESSDLVTHAYDAGTGARRWVARYSPQDGRTAGIDTHAPAAVALAGDRVLVGATLGYRPDTGTLTYGSLGSSDLGILGYPV